MMKKALTWLLCVTLLLTCMAACLSFSAAAETKVKLLDLYAQYKGGHFEEINDGLGFKADMSETTPEGWGYLYINLAEAIETTPYLVYQCNVCNGGWCTICPNGWINGSEAVNLEKDGERHVFDLRPYLEEYPSLCICLTMESEMDFPLAYLTDTDEDGNVFVYVKPTQPPVPDGQEGHMLRYDMPAYTEDHIEEDTGYQWLMHTDITAEPGENGKGFRLRRKEGSDIAAANIAWVIPYEEIEKTPYLIVDIGNEGRPDEGPQVSIYAYWEHVVGSGAYFDGMRAKYHGANGLNGVNAFNLKYAVDNVKEELHGDDGIAIIIALDWSAARSDGTVLDDLIVNDVYLMGWEDGCAGDGLFVDMGKTTPTDPTTPSTQSGTPATQPTDKPADGGESKGSFPWVWVCVAVGVVVVAAAVVIVIRMKKK